MIVCGLNVIKHDRLALHEGQILVNSFIPPLNSEAFHNMVLQVPGDGEAFFVNHVEGIRKAPISSYIAVTNRCMYCCWHCSAQKPWSPEGTIETENKQLTTEQLLYIVEQLQTLGVSIIGFTGGEPLLRTDLETIISSITLASTSFVFSTGYGLDYKRACALKEAGLFGIAISIDSPDAKSHDALRQYEGSFEIAITALENAKKAGLYTMSQTVATRETLKNGDLLKLALFFKTLGIDEMRIMEPLPCGRLSGNIDSTLTEEEIEQLKQLHVTLNENKKYAKASVFPYFESEDQFGCGAGIQHSYVDASGNFGPCDFVDKTYGNILNEDVLGIWNTMHSECGKPSCTCIAKGCCETKDYLPKFYRLLRGVYS